MRSPPGFLSSSGVVVSSPRARKALSEPVGPGRHDTRGRTTCRATPSRHVATISTGEHT
jgi:hypothetical protein